MAVGALLPIWRWQILQDGEPVLGAKLYTWLSGTSTPQPVYTTSAITVERTNPVVADIDGVFPVMYLAAVAYRMEVTDSNGVTIYGPQDGIFDFGQVQGLVPSFAGVAGEALDAGTLCYLSDGSGALLAGRWYKADADQVYSSMTPILAFAMAATAQGATGRFQEGGSITLAGPLVAGTTYYVSGTAGAITATAPLHARVVGVADTATSLVISANPAPMSLATVVVSQSTTYTALEGTVNQLILVDATLGAVAINLYTAVGTTGQRVSVVKTDSSVNPVTIDPSGSQTINGSATRVLRGQYDGATLVSDGANWVGTPQAPAAGSVVQVVSVTYATETASASAAYADTGLTASITPRYNNSKVLVLVNQAGLYKINDTRLALKLVRGVTDLAQMDVLGAYTGTAAENSIGGSGLTYLDSPASVSAQTYKTQFASTTGAASVKVQVSSATSSITLMEIAQ